MMKIKPYENIKGGEKKLIITSNAQEHKAQVAQVVLYDRSYH
jgi:hypothetical protein